jgi:Arc/MetJ-type ribon-helix-helix transcriptional regulator
MSQIAVRLTEDELKRLDAAVEGGKFRSRADAVRAAMKLLEAKLLEAHVAESYRAAYATSPPTAEEARALDAAAALVADVAL